ncbi:MAG: DUF3380 domain-containing protein [Flavobacteriales bacterium]|nr:DUF3380 domain-containing protein [Flavobacteriales bacterium]
MGNFPNHCFNYTLCGFDSIKAFVKAQYISEGEHLKAFGNFIKSAKLVKYLRTKNWAAFAKGYNGPAYAKNRHDVKLKKAYEKYSQ